MKAYWGSGCIAPRLLDLGTRWRWVVSFTPRSLYPRGKHSLIPTGLEAGWAPEPVWTRWWGKKFPSPTGTRTPYHPARSPALCHWANLVPNCKCHIISNGRVKQIGCGRKQSWTVPT
jgi:hypothetical protein